MYVHIHSEKCSENVNLYMCMYICRFTSRKVVTIKCIADGYNLLSF